MLTSLLGFIAVGVKVSSLVIARHLLMSRL